MYVHELNSAIIELDGKDRWASGSSTSLRSISHHRSSKDCRRSRREGQDWVLLFDGVLTRLTRQCISIHIPGRRVSISVVRLGRKLDRKPSPALSAASGVSTPPSSLQLKPSIMQNQARVNSTPDSAGAQGLGKVISHDSGRPEHRIGILMSQTGRFLECISCRLSFAFPPGTQYETVAKQFESHICRAVTPGSEG